MKFKIQSKNGYKIINLNRRKAIRERCLNCVAWSPSEVANCTLKDCQLFPFRMGTGKQDSKIRAKAIRDYCLWCCGDQSFEIRQCQVFTCPLWAFRKSSIDRSLESKTTTEKGHIERSTKAATA